MEKRIYKTKDNYGLVFTKSKRGNWIPCGGDSTEEWMKMKKEDVLGFAEDFFSNRIKKEIKEKYYKRNWTCWHTGAVSLVAAIVQQSFHFRMNALVAFCEYEELIKLASMLDDIDDIKTLLHVCRTKEEHKKFYSVIKESFMRDRQFMPFLGHIEQGQKTIMNAVEEQEFPSHIECNRSMKQTFSICISAAALIALAAICIL